MLVDLLHTQNQASILGPVGPLWIQPQIGPGHIQKSSF